MSDAWEQAHGLNRTNAADGPAVARNGYTNVENYLNELAGDSETGPTQQPLPAPKNLRLLMVTP